MPAYWKSSFSNIWLVTALFGRIESHKKYYLEKFEKNCMNRLHKTDRIPVDALTAKLLGIEFRGKTVS